MKAEKYSIKIKIFLKRFLTWQFLIGIILGAAGGFAYYYFIGCNSGSCPITSNPVNTVLYGVLIGGLLSFKDKNKEKQNNHNIKDKIEI